MLFTVSSQKIHTLEIPELLIYGGPPVVLLVADQDCQYSINISEMMAEGVICVPYIQTKGRVTAMQLLVVNKSKELRSSHKQEATEGRNAQDVGKRWLCRTGFNDMEEQLERGG